MKKIMLLVGFSFILFSSDFAQSTFDESLNEVSIEIAGKLSQKNIKRIVVLYVTDNNKAQTDAGKYIADVISVNLVNDQGNFEIFDRENLSGIVEAKKMMAEGYIDSNKAKELGKILAVDAIVIGNYTVLNTHLKLTLKALDVNSGFVVAATMKDLLITTDAGALLGIAVDNSDNNANKGFNNHPLNSFESYNNPETVNKASKANNTGDYCFQNNTKFKLTVSLSGGWDGQRWTYIKTCTLQSGQTQCFYDLINGAANYAIGEYKMLGYTTVPSGVYMGTTRPTTPQPYNATGEIYIETSKSKTFIIK